MVEVVVNYQMNTRAPLSLSSFSIVLAVTLCAITYVIMYPLYKYWHAKKRLDPKTELGACQVAIEQEQSGAKSELSLGTPRSTQTLSRDSAGATEHMHAPMPTPTQAQTQNPSPTRTLSKLTTDMFIRELLYTGVGCLKQNTVGQPSSGRSKCIRLKDDGTYRLYFHSDTIKVKRIFFSPETFDLRHLDSALDGNQDLGEILLHFKSRGCTGGKHAAAAAAASTSIFNFVIEDKKERKRVIDKFNAVALLLKREGGLGWLDSTIAEIRKDKKNNDMQNPIAGEIIQQGGTGSLRMPDRLGVVPIKTENADCLDDDRHDDGDRLTAVRKDLMVEFDASNLLHAGDKITDAHAADNGASINTALTVVVPDEPEEGVPAEPKYYGKRGHLTADQSKSLQDFMNGCDKDALEMSRFTSEAPQDAALRFLRARKFSVDKALALLSESKVLRLASKTAESAAMTENEAGGCDVSVFRTFYPHAIAGYSHNRLPIVWEATGRINIQAVISIMNRDCLMAYHFWNMETCLDGKFTECSKVPPPLTQLASSSAAAAVVAASPSPSASPSSPSSSSGLECGEGLVDGFKTPSVSPHEIATFAVLDLREFGLAQCGQKTMDQVKLYISTDNTCYPETLGKMLLINAPYVLSAVWGVVKGWLDARTRNKIEIVSSAEASLKRLRDFIPEDQIPAEYGGPAPPLYAPKPNCEFIWIGRSSEHSMEVCVPAGSSVTIDSYVVDGAIEFSVESRQLPTDAEKEAERVRREADSKSRWFSAKDETSQFAALAYQPTVTHTSQYVINPAEPGVVRTRHLQELSPTDLQSSSTGAQLRVTWKNTSRMSQRSIVYAVTVQQPGVLSDRK
jgi:hypothetical protein